MVMERIFFVTNSELAEPQHIYSILVNPSKKINTKVTMLQ